MYDPQNHDYFAMRVRTANPAQLHLLLVEGAIRFVRQADQALLRSDELTANHALLKALDIVGEMISGVRHAKTEVNEKLSRLYEFVYARLALAYVNADRVLLAESLRVLDFQRETWRMACEKVSAAPAEAGSAAPKAPVPMPHLDGLPTSQGVSFEA